VRVGVLVAAAGAVGLAAALPMVLMLSPWRDTMPNVDDPVLYLFTHSPAPLGLAAAGAGYGLLAPALTGRGSRLASGLAGAAVFPASLYLAARATLGPLNETVLAWAGELAAWAGQPDATWFSVATTFGAAAACVAFPLTAAVGLAAGARGALWRAAVVALATFAVYVAVGAALEPLPGWGLERGHGAMRKVTAVCALVSGCLGAALALRLMARGGSAS
jgi:hypothetical protein